MLSRAQFWPLAQSESEPLVRSAMIAVAFFGVFELFAVMLPLLLWSDRCRADTKSHFRSR
jgi:hypothetical protein